MNKIKNSSTTILTLTIILLLLILSACGAGNGSESAQAETTATNVVIAPTEAVESATATPEPTATAPAKIEAPQVEATTSVSEAAPAPTQEPLPAEITYADLTPYIVDLRVTHGAETIMNGVSSWGSFIELYVDPDKAQLVGGEFPDSMNFSIVAAEPIQVFSVVRVDTFDGTPGLMVTTDVELSDRAVLQIAAGEIEVKEAAGSPNSGPFSLELSKQLIAAAPNSTASDSLAASAEPAVVSATPVDLAPFVQETKVDFKSWDDVGYESYIELVLDGTKIKGVNQGPANDSKSREAKHFSVVQPEVIAAVVVETTWDDLDQQLKLGIWLEKDIPNAVIVSIAAGELELTQPDGQVTSGPFVLQLAHTTTTPVVLAADTPLPPTTTAADSVVSASGEEALYPVLVGKKWGFINKTGQMVIEPQFMEVHAFKFPTFVDGLEAVAIEQKGVGSWAYINRSGQIVIEPVYHSWTFSEGLASFSDDTQKVGYMNTTGQVIVEPKFDKAFPLSEGLANFQLGNKWGFIDPTGQIVIEPQFDEVWEFSEGLAPVRTGSKYGFIDKMGQVVIEPQFDSVSRFADGLAPVGMVSSGNQWGYIDATGQFYIQPRFTLARSFSEGLAAVEIGNQWGYIDKTGELVIEPLFDTAGNFSEGLAPVQIKDEELYGYIDQTGAIVFQLPIEFPNDAEQKRRMQEQIILGSFYDGVAMIKFNTGVYGYIDQTGNYIWNPQTDALASMDNSDSAGDTLVIATPTPAALPESTTPPAPAVTEGTPLPPDQYTLLSLATSLTMLEAMKGIQQSLQNPSADRDSLIPLLTSHAEVIQSANKLLVNLSPPADLQDEHAILLEGSTACEASAVALVDGFKNANQEILNTVGPLMSTCVQKVSEAAQMLQSYTNSAGK